VVVTNTLGSAAASTASDTAEIEVNNLENAQVPGITAHPQEAVYLKDTAAAALGVTATVSDGGTLSYQWYQNAENASTGGTAVGTNEASYTPPTNTEGTWYYYVTVSNTIADNDDGGVKTQSLSSNPAKIIVAASLPDLAAIAVYLAATPEGGTAADPVTLPVGMELNTANWSGILAAIAAESKYADLDLSACTGGTHSFGGGLYVDGTFDPNNTINIGKNRIVSLVLPDAAISIKGSSSTGDVAFRYFTGLADLTGANVKTIGSYAFANCTALATVSLPAVTRIDDEVFRDCTALKTVSLPASLTYIADNPFMGCTNLTGITVDVGNSKYKHSDDHRMILDKAGAALIAYPTAGGTVDLSSITRVGSYAFYGCTALETVILPVAATIGIDAFYDCTALETVDLPVAVTIGFGAFSGCTALETISLPEATTIGIGAFSECIALEEVSLPAATSIGIGAFQRTALETVSLPEATSIGDLAFYGCTALKTVSLPVSTSIGTYAFSYTGTTKALTIILGNTPPELETDMFYDVPNTYTGETGTKSVTVKVPDNTAWNTIISAYNSVSTINDTWGNAFRGGGWDGDTYLDGTVNSSINLTIAVLP
jgi:hypothetical protein